MTLLPGDSGTGVPSPDLNAAPVTMQRLEMRPPVANITPTTALPSAQAYFHITRIIVINLRVNMMHYGSKVPLSI